MPPNHPLETEPLVDNIIGAGVDPAFDKLIGSLGSIAKAKPKPVIDSVMFWRKSKSDAANSAREVRKVGRGGARTFIDKSNNRVAPSFHRFLAEILNPWLLVLRASLHPESL